MKKQNGKTESRALPTRLAAWFRRRIDLSPLVAMANAKTVPIHRTTWIYALGGAALFLFAIQVATGGLLMLYYQPAEATAHASVERIMSDVPYGGMIRSLHAWGANLFILVVGLHFLTTLLTRAYREPRELTWLTGMGLLLLALGFGFSGYLLPWSELSYYATLVGTQIPGTVPGVGDFVVHVLRGGDQVTGATITRFHAAHVMLLPIAFGAVCALHLGLIQAQGMSLPPGTKDGMVRDRRPFFSEFLLVEASVWLALFGVLVTLAMLWPTEIGVEADRLKAAPQGIKPEWYFLVPFYTLKHVPEVVGVLLFAAVAIFFVLLPFLDRAEQNEGRHRWLTGVLVVLATYAAIVQVIAFLAPGVENGSEMPSTESHVQTDSLVWLFFLWLVVVFLVVYLLKLARLNARVRRMYCRGDEAWTDGESLERSSRPG